MSSYQLNIAAILRRAEQFCARREGQSVRPDELRAFLAERVPKWWLPERFEFIDALPKTAVGKFKKTALRERFAANSGGA